jgi:hypothetical protein
MKLLLWKKDYFKFSSFMASRIKKIREKCGVCYYCGEPFKECDTLIPGIGVIIGEVDIKKYLDYCWHHGCIIDYKKETINCK